MNLRGRAYFALVSLRGQPVGACYRRFLREVRAGIPPTTTRDRLVAILKHCRRSVPYYAEIMRRLGGSFEDDPEEYLRRFPVLTKGIVRGRLEELKSADLDRRRWYFNTSGGSTGEPLKLIQDWEFAAKAGAIKLLFSKLAGREVGEAEISLWASSLDMTGRRPNWRAVLAERMANATRIGVFRMTDGQMRDNIALLNARRPKLVVAYAGALYELARFAEREGLEVRPQAAIITSASTLYPFMRETIERVFQCRVFDRYGSREVGDVACERPDLQGLWVAPWGNYVEITDPDGARLPDGTPGEILVTSLTNFAMPLVRYKIEDRGVLAPAGRDAGGGASQILESVIGRTYDRFINESGELVESGQFMPLLYFREWIRQYQVVQKSPSHIVFRIVKTGSGPKPGELDELRAGCDAIMHHPCRVDFEFPDEIVPAPSGKHRFIISEVPR